MEIVTDMILYTLENCQNNDYLYFDKHKLYMVFTKGNKEWEKRKDRPISEETRKKMSDAHKGKPKSDEWKHKIGLGNIGKKMSLESKEKIRAFALKRFSDPNERKKLSERLTGHRGYSHTLEYKQYMSRLQTGNNNSNWKGEEICLNYYGLHTWISREKIKPTNCDNCKLDKKLELHNLSGNYTRDLSDWIWVCRACHMKLDGRTEQLYKNRWG